MEEEKEVGGRTKRYKSAVQDDTKVREVVTYLGLEYMRLTKIQYHSAY